MVENHDPMTEKLGIKTSGHEESNHDGGELRYAVTMAYWAPKLRTFGCLIEGFMANIRGRGQRKNDSQILSFDLVLSFDDRMAKVDRFDWVGWRTLELDRQCSSRFR